MLTGTSTTSTLPTMSEYNNVLTKAVLCACTFLDTGNWYDGNCDLTLYPKEKEGKDVIFFSIYFHSAENIYK